MVISLNSSYLVPPLEERYDVVYVLLAAHLDHVADPLDVADLLLVQLHPGVEHAVVELVLEAELIHLLELHKEQVLDGLESALGMVDLGKNGETEKKKSLPLGPCRKTACTARTAPRTSRTARAPPGQSARSRLSGSG